MYNDEYSVQTLNARIGSNIRTSFFAAYDLMNIYIVRVRRFINIY